MLRVGSVLGRNALAGLPSLGWAEPVSERQLDDQTARCRRLWVAVLSLALGDATSRGPARAWLSTPSRSRRDVLELAGIDEQVFIERGLPRLQMQWQAIDAGAAHPRSIRRYCRERLAA